MPHDVNQTPEQAARDRIDGRLRAAGWHVQDKNALDFNAGLGIAVREYQTEIGPADYVLFADRQAVGVIEAKPDSWRAKLTTVEEQSEGSDIRTSANFCDDLLVGAAWHFVGERQVCARILGTGLVEFVDEWIKASLAGIASEPDESDAEDAVLGFRDDFSVGCEQGTEQFACNSALSGSGDEGLHHAGLGAVCDHSDDVEEQALVDGQGVERLVFGEVGGANMGGEAAAGCLEFVDFQVQFGEFALALFALLRLSGSANACMHAADAGEEPADILLDFTLDGVDDPRRGIDRLEGVDGGGIEVELLAHVLEEVLLRPPREQGAGDLRHGQVRMGGDQRRLRAAVEPSADLPHLEAIGQLDGPLREGGEGLADPDRTEHRHRDPMKRSLRPVLSVEGLVPGDDRDAALRRTPEQRRAPALAVEDQRQGRLARVRRREIRRVRRQHAERLQLGDDIRLQSLHHLRIEYLVQA